MWVEPPDLEGMWDRSRAKIRLEACGLLNCYSFPLKESFDGSTGGRHASLCGAVCFVLDLGDTML